LERANLGTLLRSVALEGSRKQGMAGGRHESKERLCFFIIFEMEEITSCLCTDENHPMDMEKPIPQEREERNLGRRFLIR